MHGLPPGSSNLDGHLRLAQRAAENGDTEILRLDDGGFSKIYSCSVFEECNALEFNRDGQRGVHAHKSR